VVQLSKNFRKNLAIDFRKKGFSYSEIMSSISVPKSTLSYWLRNLVLTEAQLLKLKNRQHRAGMSNLEKRKLKFSRTIEKIKDTSARDVKNISQRELWLIGIVLYWRERFLSGNESDLQKGVRFASSDPHLIKLFLKWLQQVGRIKDEEITLDIFIGKDKKDLVDEGIKYWSQVTGFPKDTFSHIYFQNKKTTRKISKKLGFGFLRIRVKASSMLARQIAGWARGIKQQYWND